VGEGEGWGEREGGVGERRGESGGGRGIGVRVPIMDSVATLLSFPGKRFHFILGKDSANGLIHFGTPLVYGDGGGGAKRPHNLSVH